MDTKTKSVGNLIELQYESRKACASAPVSFGLPLSQGTAKDAEQIRIVDGRGAELTSQRKVLQRWKDQSIRWCLVEFYCIPSETYRCEVQTALPPKNEKQRRPMVMVDASGAGIEDSSHLLRFHRDEKTSAKLQIKLRHDERDFWAVAHSKLETRDSESKRTDSNGPVRWSNSWSIRFADQDSQSPLIGELTVSSYADTSLVNFEFSILNPQAMDHPGGNWDLGARGNVIIQDLSVYLVPESTEEPRQFSYRLQGEDSEVVATKHLQVIQYSSGGENWDSPIHVNRHQELNVKLCGYRIQADGVVQSGKRAEPIVELRYSTLECSLAYPNFWQNFPKSISASANGFRLGLFPSESGSEHELQGGEQKTHEFSFDLRPSGASSAIEASLFPPCIRLDLDEYAKSNAWPYLVPNSDVSDLSYEALVKLAIEGEDTFARKSEKVDQFGWRNFGDIYGDHEAVFHQGEKPMVSHYNNQYDCTLGFAVQYLRSGDARWFQLMTQMADHAWDIDTYHTDQDKLLYNGGLFWHTYHYADAHTATHRSYPKQLRVSQSFDGGQDLANLGETGKTLAKTYAIGGGPAAAHNYSTGWMLAYFLTGKERYRNAAINAADYVMKIDDGAKTQFRWLCRSDTGFSTCSSDGYYGPGRASANSTHALLTGHQLTGEAKYLERAATLMRRTVHPEQNLDDLDLLNAELRWFYTMYLQALGRYVDYKLELGQQDDDFAYGVASLLHYANWMAQHERLTLSAPEKLQYPTETWAAQDMRKWHVLRHAADYEGDPKLRRLLIERSEYFFRQVCDSLSQFPTRSLCRPVVLMLNFGWQRDWFLKNSDIIHVAELPQTSRHKFGTPKRFLPQRTVAIKRFKSLVAMMAVVFLMLVLAVAIVVFSW